MPLSLISHEDGQSRCSWCGQGEGLSDYIHYHDHEWGLPVKDEQRLFEKMTLEGFQSGLSWLTILRKRDSFRAAFHGFDIDKVARLTSKDVERLLQDASIVRHRGKIQSCIHNAGRVADLLDKQGSGAFSRLIWSYEPEAKSRPRQITPEVATTLSQTTESQALSKALKKLGFRFVGPTTMYAFMQSMGVVNDHLQGCAHRKATEDARAAFERP